MVPGLKIMKHFQSKCWSRKEYRDIAWMVANNIPSLWHNGSLTNPNLYSSINHVEGNEDKNYIKRNSKMHAWGNTLNHSFETRTGPAGRPGTRPTRAWNRSGWRPKPARELARSTRWVDPGPGPPGQTRVRPDHFIFYFPCH